MGNRGTTPSWDDEQINKYGLFNHLDFVARMNRAAHKAELHKKLAQELTKLLHTKQMQTS